MIEAQCDTDITAMIDTINYMKKSLLLNFVWRDVSFLQGPSIMTEESRDADSFTREVTPVKSDEVPGQHKI